MESMIKSYEHTSVKLQEISLKLSEIYPFCKYQVIGKSVLGKDIYALKIGNAPQSVLYAAAFHGLERITSLLLLRFLENLCNALKRGTEISKVNALNALKDQSLILIPCVNPDGCDISLNGHQAAGRLSKSVYNISKGDISGWQANARGVDINHNFDANWQKLRRMEIKAGITCPAPTRFGGTHPHSEPETAALVNLCRKNHIKHVLAFHSQGEEIYWHYGENTPEISHTMAKVLAISSGYSLEAPIGLASYGGFKDWFIEEFSRPGFTIEIGKGKNPLPISNLNEIYIKLEEMMMLGLVI